MHTVILSEPDLGLIEASVWRRVSDPDAPTTQRILFARELAWIAEQGLDSFVEQGPDLTQRFSFGEKGEAEAFERRWAGNRLRV